MLGIYPSLSLSLSRYARTCANEFFYGSVSDSMAAKIAPASLIFDMKSGKGQYLVGTRDRLSHSRFTDFPPGPDKKGGQPTVKIPRGTSINSRKYFARELHLVLRLFRHISRICAYGGDLFPVLAEQRVETFTLRFALSDRRVAETARSLDKPTLVNREKKHRDSRRHLSVIFLSSRRRWNSHRNRLGVVLFEYYWPPCARYDSARRRILEATIRGTWVLESHL